MEEKKTKDKKLYSKRFWCKWIRTKIQYSLRKQIGLYNIKEWTRAELKLSWSLQKIRGVGACLGGFGFGFVCVCVFGKRENNDWFGLVVGFRGVLWEVGGCGSAWNPFPFAFRYSRPIVIFQAFSFPNSKPLIFFFFSFSGTTSSFLFSLFFFSFFFLVSSISLGKVHASLLIVFWTTVFCFLSF